MFENLLNANADGGMNDPSVHVSVVGGPTAGERILSIDIGGPRE